MEKELPFEVPCIVNGKPVRTLSHSIYPSYAAHRSRQASSRSSRFPLTTPSTSARTTKRTRRLSLLPSMVLSLPRRNGSHCPGATGPQSS